MTTRLLTTSLVLVLSLAASAADASPPSSATATAKSPTRRFGVSQAPARPVASASTRALSTDDSLSLGSPLRPALRDQATSEAPPVAHHFTVTLNPLALALGRYGINGEALFARHHAVVASGYLQTFSKSTLHALLPSVKLGDGPAARIGGELGYRFYSGSDGPTGVFVGPSVVAMPLAYPRVNEELRAEVVSFMAYGAALDVGVQAIIGPGFTLGGGVGVMALAWQPPTSVQPPPGVTAPTYPEPHVLPRLLVTAGWAF